MLHEYLRVLKYDGTTFSDLSLDNQNESTNLDLALTTTDYIYLGQYFAFNNFFINLDTANASTSILSLEYWNGSEWKSALDLLDGTSLSGVTLSQSGVVQFSPDRLYGWNRVSDTSEASAPTEMQSLTIYNMMWLRFKPTINIDALTDAFSVSYAFTSSQQLNNHDIEINNYYDRFAVGKTDWNNEIVTASRYLVADLKRKNIVQDHAQILRFDDVSLACEWKTLEHIYNNMGKAYVEKRDDARTQYDKYISIRERSLDKNNDASLSMDELKGSIRNGIR